MDLCGFQDSLVYVVSHRLTKVTWRDSVSNKTKPRVPKRTRGSRQFKLSSAQSLDNQTRKRAVQTEETEIMYM
ncbi:rCG63191 [Rattus norvegicus]|uniref:RCG63191 n=1 Tax=Rattus norvegicus TaxID=10116 RepID=A6JYW1_RAT|nr:rCG63191 [Rattus norvegicus]